MKPVLFTIGNYNVMSYSFFMMVGLVVAFLVTIRLSGRSSVGLKDYGRALIIGSLGMFVGARALNVYLNFSGYMDDPSRIVSFDRTGFSMYGGLILAYILIRVDANRRKLPQLELTDTMVPGLCLALSAMRFGCIANGCCYGHETHFPWGVPFPAGQLKNLNSLFGLISGGGSSLTLYHPTQLYEAIGVLVIGLVCLLIIKKGYLDGRVTMIFIAGFTCVRWSNYYMRIYPSYMDDHALFYPVLYGMIMLWSIAKLMGYKKSGRSKVFSETNECGKYG